MHEGHAHTRRGSLPSSFPRQEDACSESLGCLLCTLTYWCPLQDVTNTIYRVPWLTRSDRDSICLIAAVGMATGTALRSCLCWKLHGLDFLKDTLVQKQLEHRICTEINTCLPQAWHGGTFLFGAGLILFSTKPLPFTVFSQMEESPSLN